MEEGAADKKYVHENTKKRWKSEEKTVSAFVLSGAFSTAVPGHNGPFVNRYSMCARSTTRRLPAEPSAFLNPHQ